MKAFRTALFALVLGAVVASGSASANTAASAQALFEEGRALMAAGNFAAACPKLEGSQRLDPGPGTTYNLALCYDKLGKTASAWVTYLNAAAAYKATNRPDWEAKARERATQLAGTLSKLTIVAPPQSPADLRVTRDGVELVASELGVAIPVDPGTHVIEATANGRAPFRANVDVGPSANKSIAIELASSSTGANAPGTPRPGETPPPAETGATGSTQRTLAWIAVGVGAAGLATSAVTGLLAVNENSASVKECPNDGPCSSQAALDANSSARDFATVSTISFVAGAAVLGIGVLLHLTAPPRTNTRAFVSPLRGLGNAGMVVAF